MTRIAIIDYGMGNLHSVSKAVEHVAKVDVIVSSDADVIRKADKVIFPGVGAIRDCIAELQLHELTEVVKECAQSKPFLGVCLGMQALLSHSDENDGIACLDIFAGNVKRFASGMTDEQGNKLKIPHMGWNQVEQVRAHPLWRGIANSSRFYFVHSYYVSPDDDNVTVGQTKYGVTFSSVIARENIFAGQFHPEKSQHAGMQLLTNFVNWDGNS